MADTQTWAYIARITKATRHHAAGTVAAASVDRPEDAAANAKYVAKWMREGCTIERVPVEWVRKYLLTTEPYRPRAHLTPRRRRLPWASIMPADRL